MFTPQNIGFIATVGVTFNCRVVGYQICALVRGTLTVDIEHSTPYTHPAGGTPDPSQPGSPMRFPSLIGTGSTLPAINGIYAENLDTSTWALRDLSTGDMLHFWLTQADLSILYATMFLYLQDMDEKIVTVG